MASNVSNALGTQQQFSAKPQDAYMKKLTQVNSSVGVEVSANTDGVRLAQSLGVLGVAISAELAAAEKRKEKVDADIIEKATAGTTDQEWRTLGVSELLAKRGFQTADDPSVRAGIERYRGKYFSANFNAEYQLWRKEQKRPKSVTEEGTQYTKFMHEKYAEVADISVNQDMFKQGYFDNFMPQAQGHMANFIKEQSADLDAHRIGGAAADLGNVTLNYNTMSKEQIAEAYTNTAAKIISYNGMESELRKQLEEALPGLAERSGDVELISYLWENVTVGVDAKGQPVKLGNYIDLSHAVKIAEASKRIKMDKDVYDMQEKLSTMSIPDIFKTVEDLEKNPETNHLYQSIAPMVDTIINNRKIAEAKAKAAQFNSMVKGAAEDKAFKLIQRHLGLYINGKTEDLNGFPVANSLSDFKNREKWVDANGKEHDVEVTPTMLNSVIRNELDFISKTSHSEGEMATRSLKVLKWGGAKDYADSFKQQLSNELGSITADKLGRDGNGQAVLTGNLKSAMTMYYASRESFSDIFGTDSTKQLGTIELLRGGTGSLEKAVSLYAQSRDNRSNPERRRQVEAVIGQELPRASMDGFQGMDGSSNTVDQSLATNWDMMDRVKEVAETLMYTGGYTTAQAIETAKKHAQGNYFSYRGTAIPKGLFEDLNVNDKATNGKEILDDAVSIFREQHPELSNETVWVDYNEERGIFTVNGGGHEPMSYSKQELVAYGNKKAAQWYEDTKNGVFNADDINAERDRRRLKVPFGMSRLFGG